MTANKHVRHQTFDNWHVGYEYPLFEFRPFSSSQGNHSTGHLEIDDYIKWYGIETMHELAEHTVIFVEYGSMDALDCIYDYQ